MKIFPLGIPPHPYSVPHSYYQNSIENRIIDTDEYIGIEKTFSLNDFSNSNHYIDGNYVTFHEDINHLSPRYLENFYKNHLGHSQKEYWKLMSVYNLFFQTKLVYYDTEAPTLDNDSCSITHFNRRNFFTNRPWIERGINKYAEHFTNLTQSERNYFMDSEGLNSDHFFQMEDNFYNVHRRRHGERYQHQVCDILLYKLFTYLCDKYYGNCTFNTRCKSARTFYYFEFLDHTAQSFKAAGQQPLLNFNDDFYFKSEYLITTSDILLPIMYYHRKLEALLYLKFDLVHLPKDFRFKYLNYHSEYKLVLGYFDATGKGAVFCQANGLPLGCTDFFFYLPWEYAGVEFTEKLTQEIVVHNFMDDKYGQPEFYINHIIKDGSVNGITKSEIIDVIKKSGLEVTKTNFPITHLISKPDNYYLEGFGKNPKDKFSILNYIVNPDSEDYYSFLSRLPYRYFNILFADYYLNHITKKKDIIGRVMNKSKRLIADSETNKDEWQKICSYIGNNFRLKDLQHIAGQTFSVQPSVLAKLSKRELCKLLSQYTYSQQKKAVKKYLQLRTIRYPIPDGICRNYSEDPDMVTSINDMVRKLYHPDTTRLTDEEVHDISNFLIDKIDINPEELDTLNNESIKEWKQLLDKWTDSLKPFMQMPNEDFIVIVKPDLTAWCISVDMFQRCGLRHYLCTWTLKEGHDGDMQGHDYRLSSPIEKIYKLPFQEQGLEEVASVSPYLFINESAYLRITYHIRQNQGSSKLLIFYLGEPTISRTGNCQGHYGVSQLHGQYHSTKPIYPVVYRRRISRDIYIPPESESDSDESAPKENPEVRKQLDMLKAREADIIRMRQQYNEQLKPARDAYEQSPRDAEGNYQLSELEYIQRHYPSQEGLYKATEEWRKVLIAIMREKMRLNQHLYS